jgi:hypothetical protein
MAKILLFYIIFHEKASTDSKFTSTHAFSDRCDYVFYFKIPGLDLPHFRKLFLKDSESRILFLKVQGFEQTGEKNAMI